MLAKNLQAAAGNAAEEAPDITELFSTYLYNGTDADQTITNGIDLAGEGGLVWIKNRPSVINHNLYDTVRGATNLLKSNTTDAQSTVATSLLSFTSSGFVLGGFGNVNNSGFGGYCSWTFRKQPKFFDVVTYTGNGVNNTLISHNLGSTPGCVIIKRTDTTENWAVNHRGDGTGNAWTQMSLNSTSAGSQGVAQNYATSTTVRVDDVIGAGSSPNGCNVNGATYVMYLFAHNAGGFGLTGTDNVISCGSLVSTGGVVNVNLGYETQWLLIKNASNIDSWYMYDTMRGMSMTDDYFLKANSSNAESNFGASYVKPTATGFSFDSSAFGASGETYIYIAIRRGPMKVPESGTSVFAPVAYSGTGATRTITGVGFPLDANIVMRREAHTYNLFSTRLQGLSADGSSVATPSLASNTTDAEFTTFVNSINATSSSAMDGYTLYNAYTQMNASGGTYVSYNFRRAPGFMDVCCYTGTGSATTVAHNLGVAPELMIIKSRSTGYGWTVYAAGVGNTSFAYLNEPDGFQVNSTAWNNTSPTNSVFTVGTGPIINASGSTFVAYLFASCPGVSKCGSYTGTGTTLQINCGFTAGARFVLIKRTDSTGDWYVWDSARGIVSGNDSYLLLNSTAAEVTSTDYIDTYSAGFEISSTAPAAINASGGSFIFFAVS